MKVYAYSKPQHANARPFSVSVIWIIPLVVCVKSPDMIIVGYREIFTEIYNAPHLRRFFERRRNAPELASVWSAYVPVGKCFNSSI